MPQDKENPNDQDIYNHHCLFRKMYETAPDGILLVNYDTLNIEVINPALMRLLNISEDTITGKNILELEIFSEIDFCKKIINELKIKPFIRYDSDILQLSLNSGIKQKLCVEVIGHVFEYNKVQYTKLHIRDDTVRRHMEDHLRHSELSLKEAQHQAKIGSWTWDPKTDNPVWSEEMFHTFGMDPNLPPANFTEVSKLYTAASWEPLKVAVENTLKTGEPYELDTEVVKHDGTYIWATCRGEAVRDADGNILGLRGSVQDINDRKLAEKLEAETEVLKRANTMKSLFLANMSHELRSPLNSIIGFSEMLKDGLLDDLTERQKKYIGIIYESGEHLLALINDILDLSKVESGKMKLDLEYIDISSLLTNSLPMFKEQALNHNIALSIDYDQSNGHFFADARKVKQIIYNLLSNAIKFTEDSGKIILSSRRVTRDEVGKLSGNWPGRNFKLPENEFTDFIEISIIDNGIGIDPHDYEHLFLPFMQVDNKLARKYEGSGLGLALVKQMAELHGGSVMVESSLGHGSRFSVWLPLRPSIEKYLISPDFMLLPDLKTMEPGKRSVLIIEDDDQATELIRLQLEAENLQILPVKSAEAALELLKSFTPDLITLDILLPGMDGWEFLARLKQMPILNKIPVVIISMVASKNKGISLGASAVLQKPIGNDELKTALAKIGFQDLSRQPPSKILVVDNDEVAVETIAGYLNNPGFQVTRAYSGEDAIKQAHQISPDLILLELIMPVVSGFDVVEDLKSHRDTMNIPIVMVTSRSITDEEGKKLKTYGLNIHAKNEIANGSFMNEVRRSLSINRDLM